MPDTMMQPEQTERPSLKNLAAALCKAQADMEGAKKDAKNPHFNSKYADLASVWDAIRVPLTKNGLSIVQLPRSMQGGVEVETILLHTSGESLSSVLAVPASKSDAQGFGSALTYARRYSLMAMVGVAPEDDDGNAAAHKPGAPGSAGGGGDFRPDGPRRMPAQSSANGREMAASEPHLVDHDRAKGTLPGKPAARSPTGPEASSAIKRVEWVKASIEGFKGAQTKDALQEWWKAETDRLGVIEAAMPAEYERLLAAYDAAMDRVIAKAA